MHRKFRHTGGAEVSLLCFAGAVWDVWRARLSRAVSCASRDRCAETMMTETKKKEGRLYLGGRLLRTVCRVVLSENEFVVCVCVHVDAEASFCCLLFCAFCTSVGHCVVLLFSSHKDGQTETLGRVRSASPRNATRKWIGRVESDVLHLQTLPSGDMEPVVQTSAIRAQ